LTIVPVTLQVVNMQNVTGLPTVWISASGAASVGVKPPPHAENTRASMAVATTVLILNIWTPTPTEYTDRGIDEAAWATVAARASER
jgi:hypothetical protein